MKEAPTITQTAFDKALEKAAKDQAKAVKAERQRVLRLVKHTTQVFKDEPYWQDAVGKSSLKIAKAEMMFLVGAIRNDADTTDVGVVDSEGKPIDR